MTVLSITTNQVYGEVALMTIKAGKAYTVLWFCALFSIPAILWFFSDDTLRMICLLVYPLAILIVDFKDAFSVYTIDCKGISQKCLCWSRYFAWDYYKFIGIQRLTRGGGLGAAPSKFIRCSAVPLPKTMSKEEFEKKLYWWPFKTITIPLPDKNGDEVYREFLSYCGGERDIRE